jgi:hypothetical protein
VEEREVVIVGDGAAESCEIGADSQKLAGVERQNHYGQNNSLKCLRQVFRQAETWNPLGSSKIEKSFPQLIDEPNCKKLFPLGSSISWEHKKARIFF